MQALRFSAKNCVKYGTIRRQSKVLSQIQTCPRIGSIINKKVYSTADQQQLFSNSTEKNQGSQFRINPALIPRKVPDSAAYFTGYSQIYDLLIGLDKMYESLTNGGDSNYLLGRPWQSRKSDFWMDKNKLSEKMNIQFSKARHDELLEKLERLSQVIQTDENRSEILKVLLYFKRPRSTRGNSQTEITQGEEGQARKQNPLSGYKDELGRFYAIGRRKTSFAEAWLVPAAPLESSIGANNASTDGSNSSSYDLVSEDDSINDSLYSGEIYINGKPLHRHFVVSYDCETVVFPMSITGTVGKYNVWIKVSGGGRTGQCESSAMALARALS
ncbi:hypothetical protein BB560_002151 [Smittium megazygosporum]|uniref:Ribosomal protein S5 C-terminal domain-containing protein n=1 Tax=Smittium megazygosporum TaxID=133381 RepID=A0A2T9ZFL8_9FUNG|nr:hypothetical protein BB560_002151 [Smittium megazygosporum]